MTALLLIALQITLTCIVNGGPFNDCRLTNDIKSELSFCNGYIDSYVCVAEKQNLWGNWGISFKDLEVQKQVVLILEQRLEIEKGITTVKGTIRYLTHGSACFKNYVEFICKTNFPQCDIKSKLFK